MNEQDNELNTAALATGSSSARIYVLVGVLIVLGVLAGMSLPARSNWKEARKKAEAILGTDDDIKPVAFMKAIGKTPMVLDKPDGLTQVYRWTGGVRTYELTIRFSAPWADNPGAYAPASTPVATAKLRFTVDSLEGYTLANKLTGSTFAKLPKLEVDNSNEATMSPPSPEAAPSPTGPPDGFSRGPSNKGGDRSKGGRQGGGFGRSPGPPEELNLTDDQKIKWTAVSTKQRKSMRELFTSDVPREERSAKFAELLESFREEFSEILTEKQLLKYEEIRNQRPQGGRGGGRSSGPPEELKLTDDQKSKWTAASTKQREKMRKLFNSSMPREEMSAKMAEIRESFQGDVKAFLTPGQLEKYKEIESQRSQRGTGGRGKSGKVGPNNRSSGPEKVNDKP